MSHLSGQSSLTSACHLLPRESERPLLGECTPPFESHFTKTWDCSIANCSQDLDL